MSDFVRAGSYLQKGAYSATAKSATIAAGASAASPIFSFRYGAATGRALVDRVSVSIASLGTGFAAGVGYVDMVAARAFTSPDLGGYPVPTYTSATGSGTGGTMPADEYFYAVTAIGPWGETGPSAERSVTTTGATSSVAHVIAAYTGATSYRIYVGTETGVYTSYFADADGSYTQTTAAGTAGSPPAATSPGTGFVLTTNNAKRSTSEQTSGAAAIIANTVALTAGTRTLDSTPLAAVQFTVGTAVQTVALPETSIWSPDKQTYPLNLGPEEGFILRATVPATGIWQAVVSVDWREV